jgi:hypothetical protein
MIRIDARILVSTFNLEPWNESWTVETAKKDLGWALHTAGLMGFECHHRDFGICGGLPRTERYPRGLSKGGHIP